MKKEKDKQALPEIYVSGKKTYTPPALEVILIEMEHGFAATSASLSYRRCRLSQYATSRRLERWRKSGR